MLDKDKIHNSHMLIGEIVSLRGQKMVVDLIVMNILDFNVVLGWTS